MRRLITPQQKRTLYESAITDENDALDGPRRVEAAIVADRLILDTIRGFAGSLRACAAPPAAHARMLGHELA